ncbi:transaldolase [Staphylococcus epidermidis Scl25]|jgi:transaldolase|uniref:transaldolase n=1 Tax=Staphylococcus TaxID=1279 RepID=UPI00026BF71B|nr:MULTISPECIES: transaldolase [Staphylococcus]EJD86217.1 transaldolase [Staphylococcus epidermidis NIHLM070]SLC46015.1 Transaldolase [Mycobacteroides abscessus subsp. massiliense]EJD84837.1 transaldolase [Staphylococcus epidermidis NIHLM067]EJE13645.1 transaldolase [Staphylococcus epidermidis NIHLM018]EJE23797.1 transaldolase [Staphylococcus epidermidis NIHLM003]
MTKLNVKVFADGADIEEMKSAYKNQLVDGFTTNPSLMAKAGVTDYKAFADEVVSEIPDASISFEVFADDLPTMEKEAEILKQYGDNVFVKIPIVTTTGESTLPLIKRLSSKQVRLNVTAVYTIEQVKAITDAVTEGVPTYVSVFAGRIADTGIDPLPLMKESVKVTHSKEGVQLLWASCREVYNVIQADEIGADIITCPADVVKKVNNNLGRDIGELSVDTVKGFAKDIQSSGLSIL